MCKCASVCLRACTRPSILCPPVPSEHRSPMRVPSRPHYAQYASTHHHHATSLQAPSSVQPPLLSAPLFSITNFSVFPLLTACETKYPNTQSQRGAPHSREREREMLPTPYLLILGGMSSGSRRYGLHAWRSYFCLAVRFSEESESTLREADVLATLPLYDPYHEARLSEG